jgi:iron complex outermembrane recepter protein
MKPFTITFLFCTFFAAIHARGQGVPDNTDTLPEALIIYRADQRTPITFQDISAAYIQARTVGQEPSFLLSETPSITNYSDAGNTQGYSYFRMRGIDQTRINITLDGVPLNEPEDQGAYFSNFPDLWNSVGQIQIQRGVGTSKNGVANYGGSIQLTSLPFADSSQSTIGVGYGSFNSSRFFGEYQSGFRKGKALYARVSQVQSEGYKYHSGNNAQSAFLSAGWMTDASFWKINLLAGRQRNQLAWLGVPESQIQEDARSNANSPLEHDAFTQCLTQLQHHWNLSPAARLQSSVYYTFLEGNYDFDFNNFLGLPSTLELYNYAFRSHLNGFFSNYSVEKRHFEWTAGIHANRYTRQHTGSEQTLGQLYQNTGYRSEISVFSKGQYQWRRFRFFADVQYRYSTFDYRGYAALEKMYWQFINPKTGLSFLPNANHTFYYNIGRTGREPTRNDLFGGNDDLLVDSLGNALLSIKSPEYVLDHELGWRYQSERLRCNANVYYLDFDNEIVLDGKFGPNGLALTNKVDQSIRAGIELEAQLRVHPRWYLTHASSLNYSRIKEQKEVFQPILTPPVLVFQEMEYRARRWSWAVSARYQHASFIDFANAAQVPSYWLWNSRISFHVKGWSLRLLANNLTNIRYFNHGYTDIDGRKKLFVQAPFNLYGALEYTF